ncbi:MAG: hypothetical protein O8C61_08660 [Candidatus Methanoperedens sp.]|nr:hypothetical protein [Candidatus Methanoperedens sp.]
MKNRNKNKEVCPKHQKQVHEKKRQNILWKQRNIGNKYDLRKKAAFKYYATREISAYNVEIDKRMGSGLLDEEIATKMKQEFSSKVDILIQMWSEAGEKRLKEKLAELHSLEAEPEEDVKDLIGI